MFSRLSRLFELLQAFGGLSSFGQLTKLVPIWFAELQALADAETSRDYHRVAINLLRPMAPLTENQLDDGVLIATEALAQSDDWHLWVNGRLSLGDVAVPDDVPVLTLPADALAIAYDVTGEADLPGGIPEGAAAFSFGDAAKLARFLPELLELIRELRKLAPAFKPAV